MTDGEEDVKSAIRRSIIYIRHSIRRRRTTWKKVLILYRLGRILSGMTYGVAKYQAGLEALYIYKKEQIWGSPGYPAIIRRILRISSSRSSIY
mgnify:CR=1 FL=1